MNRGWSLAAIFDEKAAWSLRTFGPRQTVAGVLKHLRKELVEIERKPDDLVEWVDLVLLAIDGAWRHAGADGPAFVDALVAKHEANVARDWPDWRTLSPDEPIEHVRSESERLDARLDQIVKSARTPEPTREELVAQLAEARAETARWTARVKEVEERASRAIHLLSGRGR